MDVFQFRGACFGQLEVALEVGFAEDGGFKVLDGGGFIVDGETDLAEDVENFMVTGVDFDGILRHF